MSFHNEEEADLWYSSEKERLDAEFSANIERDPENIPLHRAKYEESLKKTVLRYQTETEKLVDQEISKRNKKK